MIFNYLCEFSQFCNENKTNIEIIAYKYIKNIVFRFLGRFFRLKKHIIFIRMLKKAVHCIGHINKKSCPF